MLVEEGKDVVLVCHSFSGMVESTQIYAAWQDIPSTFAFETQNQTLFGEREMVDYMINSAKAIRPTAFDVMEECDAGHCFMISRAEWLAAVPRRATGEKDV